jgi:hypothetical protein
MAEFPDDLMERFLSTASSMASLLAEKNTATTANDSFGEHPNSKAKNTPTPRTDKKNPPSLV